jgi:hypothetical protein
LLTLLRLQQLLLHGRRLRLLHRTNRRWLLCLRWLRQHRLLLLLLPYRLLGLPGLMLLCSVRLLLLFRG